MNKIKNNYVTVILTVYNAENYLRECIESIINQTFKNLEIIIINDGSTDSSIEIINEFIPKEKRIKLYNQTNSGVSRSRNTALNKASGSWILFVDSDDILPNYSVEMMLKVALKSKADCVSGKYYLFKNENPNIKIKKNINDNIYIIKNFKAIKSLLYQREIVNGSCGKLYKYNLIKDIRFREDIFVAEDLLFNYEIIKKNTHIALIKNYVYYYRKHNSSITNKKFSDKRMSGLKATNIIMRDFNKKNLPILPAINRHFMEALFIASLIKKSVNSDKIYRIKCINIIKKYSRLIVFDHESPLEYRLYAALTIINPLIPIYLFKLKSRIYNILVIKFLIN